MHMSTIVIDPVTRIEGHLGVKAKLDSSGKIVEAWSSGLLYRGFERILIGRDPMDAPVITQRICGVCHAVHRITSSLALENAAKVTPPPDAVRIRNIIQGVNFLYSHAAHIFVLAGPDYDLYGLVSGLSEGQNLDQYYSILKQDVLPAQRLCHELTAIFGGKTPHHMTTLPGGITCVPTQEEINKAISKIGQIKIIINKYAAAILGYLDSKKSELQSFGSGYGNFLSYGVFPDPNTPNDQNKFLLKRGVVIDGKRQPLDTSKITENVKYSWYTGSSGGRPSEETPPQDSYGKNGAYSWLKSPRYDGSAVEAGPLARMVVSGYYTPAKASVYDRLKARALELVLVMNNVEKWISELKPHAKVHAPYKNPASATGFGLWEAPRGAIGHWIRINSGAIERYQIITPTNWNASPRDDLGKLGPIEQSLVGTSISSAAKPLNALKVIRSFDPCTACAVHVIDMTGRTHIFELLQTN